MPTSVAYFRDADGVTRKAQRSGATPSAADNALREALRDRLAPSTEYLTRDSLMSQLGAQWLAEIQKSKRAAATKERYAATVRAHVDKSIGSVRIREASVPRMQRLVDLVAVKSPAQSRMLGVVLTGMFGLAVRMGAAEANVGKSLLLPSVETHVVRAPAVEDVRALRVALRAFDNRGGGRSDAMHDLADIGDMLVGSGARIGEVLALRWAHDVDLANGTVRITGTVTRVRGVGIVRQEIPKSDSSNRTLSLPQFAVDMLVRRRVESHCPWVFGSATGTLRWPENVRAQWAVAVKGTAVEWMTTKACRKAVANLLEAEVDMEAAKDQLGHKDVAVTSKHYVELHMARPDRASVLDVFAENSE
ncbi:tyrosine-type recombinase/integrase [Cryobacterium arcticum]|uniref:tyrosine-type recombinase/integrase n=1 Tax=Cryobacterium arcticum TaxID=670052 RepID=UPI001431DD96|nr:site-specific integrase [Cryobacterium arcticum]